MLCFMLENTTYRKVFPLCTGDRHERHTRCREVPGLLWQLSSPDDSWTYAPCWDFLHTWTRARLPWGSDPHRHPDTHVWGRRRRLPSLPHWTRGKTCGQWMFHYGCIALSPEYTNWNLNFSFRKLMRPANGSSVRSMTSDLKLET